MRTTVAALVLALLSSSALGQSAALLPNGMQQFVDANGVPYSGGKVYFYIPNSTTAKETWQDPGQAVANQNPVILDSAGRATIYGSGQYRQELYDQFGTLVWDKLTAATVAAQGAANAVSMGADPTGASDSTAAINSCMATCSCYIPAGVYKTTDSITSGACTSITMTGAGSSVTKLLLGSTSKSVLVNSATNGYYSGLTLDRSATPSSGAFGGDFSAASNQLQLVDLVSADNYQGFWLGVTAWSWAKQLIAEQGYSDGFLLSNSFVSPAIQWNLDGVLAQRNNGWGFKVEAVGTQAYGATLLPWNNISTFANAAGGVLVQGAASAAIEGLQITNSIIESDGDDEILLDTFAQNPILISNTQVSLAGQTTTGRGLTTPASLQGSGIDVVGSNNILTLQQVTINGSSFDGIRVNPNALNVLDAENVQSLLNGEATPGATYHGLAIATTLQSGVISGGYYGNRSGATTQAFGIGATDGTGLSFSAVNVTGNNVAGIQLNTNAAAAYCFGIQGEPMTTIGCNQGGGGGSGSGTVTSVATAGAVSGGPITTAGTISMTAIADNSVIANLAGSSAAPDGQPTTYVLDHLMGSGSPSFNPPPAGSLAERGTGAWFGLTPGTNGQVLAINTSGAPTWTTLSSGLGTITGVTAGTNLTGGGTSGTVTLAVVNAPTFSGVVTFNANADFGSGDQMCWSTICIGAALGTQQIGLGATTITLETATNPVTDNTVALGTSALRWSDIQGVTETLGGNLTTNITGSGVQCVQASATGVLSGTGAACGSGGTGAVSSVTGPGAVSASPTTGAVVVDLATGPDGTVEANISGGTTSPPSLQSFSGVMDHVLGSTAGGIAVRGIGGWTEIATPSQGSVMMANSGGPAWLAAGTSGQVLTSGGTGANVSWANPAAAGVSSVTGSGAVSVSPTTGAAVVSMTSASSSNLIGTGSSSGVPAAINFSTFVDDAVASTAEGNLFTRNATGWGITAPGSPGQVLTAHGSGNLLTWTTPSSGVSITAASGGNIVVSPSPLTGTGTVGVVNNPTFSGTITANAGVAFGSSQQACWSTICIGANLGTLQLGLGATTDTLEVNTNPVSDNTVALGTSSLRWSDIRSNTATFSGNVTLASAPTELVLGATSSAISGSGGGVLYLHSTFSIAADTPTFGPLSDNTTTLGASGDRWTAVWAVNGTIQTSDLRDKKEVRDSDLGLDFIDRLRPVSFQWKQGVDTSRHYGLVAQQMEEVLGEKDFGGLARPEKAGDHYGVNYSELIAPLVKAVQELSRENGDLRARLDRLERVKQASGGVPKRRTLQRQAAVGP